MIEAHFSVTWLPSRFCKKCFKLINRAVHGDKFQKELPGLEKPPFNGDIGKLIFEKVSQEAWKLWKEDMQIKVLNESINQRNIALLWLIRAENSVKDHQNPTIVFVEIDIVTRMMNAVGGRGIQ